MDLHVNLIEPLLTVNRHLPYVMFNSILSNVNVCYTWRYSRFTW